MDPKQSLNEAIALAGGLNAFTEAVAAPSTSAVKAWRLTQVPEKYCPTIERITGVRCERLRPDVEWGVLRQTTAEA
jgi:DNA-binding transcriptional regulator YdaS (Cro superfamily)